MIRAHRQDYNCTWLSGTSAAAIRESSIVVTTWMHAAELHQHCCLLLTASAGREPVQDIHSSTSEFETPAALAVPYRPGIIPTVLSDKEYDMQLNTSCFTSYPSAAASCDELYIVQDKALRVWARGLGFTGAWPPHKFSR